MDVEFQFANCKEFWSLHGNMNILNATELYT